MFSIKQRITVYFPKLISELVGKNGGVIVWQACTGCVLSIGGHTGCGWLYGMSGTVPSVCPCNVDFPSLDCLMSV